MSKKILLTGGGTAGHVTPNLALLPYLKAEGYEIVYIGSQKIREGALAKVVVWPYHFFSERGRSAKYRAALVKR